ncbi:hypothetical protein [Kitasatospora mediocidica]|uniref:hypothetical protein n=1 Tax=Kitasatospora mediocidica TaxID=58352 RepID=UPI00056AB2BC|nr:hypothetical protein [Kitasatospora mediocidica]
MVTYAQAQDLATDWINGGVPPFQQREVRVQEFDLGFVCWAEDRAGGPSSDGGAAKLVIARETGASTLWPALPVDEVVERFQETYGRPVEVKPAPMPAEATSFLLSPPQWLQDAGAAAIAAEAARLGEPAAGPAPVAPAAEPAVLTAPPASDRPAGDLPTMLAPPPSDWEPAAASWPPPGPQGPPPGTPVPRRPRTGRRRSSRPWRPRWPPRAPRWRSPRATTCPTSSPRPPRRPPRPAATRRRCWRRRTACPA